MRGRNNDKALFRELGILAGWILGLILAAVLCWTLTREARGNALLRQVNRIFIQTGSYLRLGRLIPSGELKGRLIPGSFWYTLLDYRPDTEESTSQEKRLLIWTIITGGSFIPCAGVVDLAGNVETIFPLNPQGEALFKTLSPGELSLYQRRIEQEAKKERAINQSGGSRTP